MREGYVVRQIAVAVFIAFFMAGLFVFFAANDSDLAWYVTPHGWKLQHWCVYHGGCR